MDTKEKLQELIELLKNSDSNIQIKSDIARGGMGQVSLANDSSISRDIALKVLHDDLQKDESMCLQFVEEARITGLLEHSNIVPVHSLGINDKDQIYFTMKFVDGDPLLTVIEEMAADNEDYLEYYTQFMMLSVFHKVCDAISFAHSKGIVHRDIKPENIMIGDYGEVLVMDWGLAKFSDKEEYLSLKERISVTMTDTIDGIVKGSPAYMSPEQARGEVEEYDYRSDIFLLGATLYHMITLKTPYHHEDVKVMVDMAERCNFPHPHLAAPERQIPDELSDIIMKCMHPEKEKRYQSVEEITKALDKLMSGQIMSTQRHFKAGESIIRHGDDGKNEAFVIIEGEVEVYKTLAGKKNTYTRLHAGDVFGEMAAITDTVRSASVSALTDTTCMIITPDTLTQQLKQMPPWLHKIINALSNRLRSMDTMAHPMLMSDCTYEVCAQLKLLMMCYGTVNSDSHLEYSLPELIYEISNNLKIPEQRVRPVLAALTKVDLVNIDKNLSLNIPNWNLFSDFVEFCKDTHQLSTTSTKSISTVDIHKVYTDGTSVIHRHSKLAPNEKMPPLKTMKPLKDKLSADDSARFKQNFSKIFAQLNEYAAQSESINTSMFNGQIKKHKFNPSVAPKISTKFHKNS